MPYLVMPIDANIVDARNINTISNVHDSTPQWYSAFSIQENQHNANRTKYITERGKRLHGIASINTFNVICQTVIS